MSLHRIHVQEGVHDTLGKLAEVCVAGKSGPVTHVGEGVKVHERKKYESDL